MKKTESFEEKIENLDKILAKFDNEDINLLDSVSLYKDGIKNLKEARDLLQNAKLEIIKITESESQE